MTRKSTTTIKLYVLRNILPKCNLIYSKTFSSLYIQLLLNTNNKEDKLKNKCWLSYQTLSKNINSNERKVKYLLTRMSDLGLIKVEYVGRLKTYEVVNSNLNDINDINKFCKSLNKKLLKINSKVEEKIKLIDKIDVKNNFIYYNNLNVLRKMICRVEKIYHGSSLLFLNNFAETILNNNNINRIISEKNMANDIGISQPTVNRQVKAICLHQNDFFEICKEECYMDKELEVKFQCPICNKEIETTKKVMTHLKRCKDEFHALFKDEILGGNLDIDYSEMMQAYEQHKDKIEQKRNANKNKKDELNSISTKLVKYYYGLNNSKCPNWAKEINLIKSHLKHDMNTDEVMEVLKFMAKRGYQDMRFFNNSINDALLIKKCKDEINEEGSDSFLIKKYYKSMGQKITDRLMIQGVSKLNELRQSGYDQKQVEIIVDYMVNTRCPNFNFIINVSNEAIKEDKNKEEKVKAYSSKELIKLIIENSVEYGMIVLTDCDYQIIKKDIMMKLKEDICRGEVDLLKVNKTYNKVARLLAIEIKNRNMYNPNYNIEQWVNKINLVEV